MATLLLPPVLVGLRFRRLQDEGLLFWHRIVQNSQGADLDNSEMAGPQDVSGGEEEVKFVLETRPISARALKEETTSYR